MLARAGISQPTWYHWLAGECVPHTDLFLRLMLSMGMGLDVSCGMTMVPATLVDIAPVAGE